MVITQTLNRNISMRGQEVTGLVMDLQKPDSKYNRKSNLVPAREFQSPDHGHWKTQDDHIGAEVDDASGKICCFPVSAHTALDGWIPVERKRSAKEELLKNDRHPPHNHNGHEYVCSDAEWSDDKDADIQKKK